MGKISAYPFPSKQVSRKVKHSLNLQLGLCPFLLRATWLKTKRVEQTEVVGSKWKQTPLGPCKNALRLPPSQEKRAC